MQFSSARNVLLRWKLHAALSRVPLLHIIALELFHSGWTSEPGIVSDAVKIMADQDVSSLYLDATDVPTFLDPPTDHLVRAFFYVWSSWKHSLVYCKQNNFLIRGESSGAVLINTECITPLETPCSIKSCALAAHRRTRIVSFRLGERARDGLGRGEDNG